MNLRLVSLAGFLLFSVPCIHAEENLAKQLANPVASLISVPFQTNYDSGYGLDGDGSVWLMNIQPVIPFTLNDDWNLISRTILPVISSNDVYSKGGSEFGLGDTVQSLFFSPAKPVDGWILGGGVAMLLPTATDSQLGTDQWGAGPTFVALRQQGPWTYGGLTNHIASFAGDDDKPDVSKTFIQPFVSYVTDSKVTYSLNTEATYDWEADDWSIPINLSVSKLLQFGKQNVQIGGGVRYWATSPEEAADGWGFRFQVTFLFPEK